MNRIMIHGPFLTLANITSPVTFSVDNDLMSRHGNRSLTSCPTFNIEVTFDWFDGVLNIGFGC